jgi:hypothetical protein
VQVVSFNQLHIINITQSFILNNVDLLNTIIFFKKIIKCLVTCNGDGIKPNLKLELRFNFVMKRLTLKVLEIQK